MAGSNKSPELAKLLSSIESTDRSDFPDENDRQEALKAARALVRRLERPWDTLLDIVSIVPATCTAAKAGLEMGVFKAMDADGGAPKSGATLAKATGADEVLINRLLKHLAAVHLVDEAGPDTYGPTAFTQKIQVRSTAAALDFLYEMVWPTCSTLPEYLRDTHYKSPVNPVDGPWQYATNSKGKHFFEWLGANPKIGANFSDVMAGYTSDRQNWIDMYPSERLLDGGKSDDVLVVDIGGNVGTDLGMLLKKHPETAGRLVLEDLESVLTPAKIPEGIKPLAHDFFTPQPVKGARAYFMHCILHDWSDEDSLRILAAIKPAMSKDSKLLVSDNVIPPTGAHPLATAMDMMMMSMLSTNERTEEDWTRLLEKGGFKITKIYSGRIESVIEAVVA